MDLRYVLSWSYIDLCYPCIIIIICPMYLGTQIQVLKNRYGSKHCVNAMLSSMMYLDKSLAAVISATVAEPRPFHSWYSSPILNGRLRESWIYSWTSYTDQLLILLFDLIHLWASADSKIKCQVRAVILHVGLYNYSFILLSIFGWLFSYYHYHPLSDQLLCVM